LWQCTTTLKHQQTGSDAPPGPTVILPGESLLTAKSVTAWARTQLAATSATSSDSTASTESALLPQAFLQLLQLLRYPDGDVRDAALKALKKAVAPTPPVTTSSSSSSSYSSLQLSAAALLAAREAAASALAVEQHTPNVRRLLRLLCRLAVRIGPENASQTGLQNFPQEQAESSASCYGSAAFVAALELRVAGDAGSSTGAGAVSGAALELLGHCLAPRQASSEQVSVAVPYSII
jgi:hypothetical protein